MTPEAKIKARIRKALDEAGAWYCMPIGTGYGRAGVPDFIGCLNGQFFAIEAKAGKGRTTALQVKEIQAIIEKGGLAIVVNEENINMLEATLKTLRERHGPDHTGF